MEFAFFYLGIQSQFAESFQYFFDMAPVLRDIIRVDQDVTQVDYYTHIKEVREYVIHEALKGCKRELHTGTNKTMLCQLPIAC